MINAVKVDMVKVNDDLIQWLNDCIEAVKAAYLIKHFLMTHTASW